MRRFHALAMFSTIGACLALVASNAHAQSAEYRIGPEDVLQIQVWSRPDLSGQVAVDLSGDLHIPLLGSVRAADRTVSELGQELVQRYAILDADISEVLVNVMEYRSRHVTVVGEVRAPGRYAFPVIPNVWEVLLGAGGASPAADLAAVQIVRKEPAEGEAKTLTVDLSKGLEGMDSAALPALRPRDTVIVPSLEGKAAGGDNFQVLGAVRTPGMYRLTAATTVIEALAVSGGPAPTADLRHVRLSRPTEGGVAAFDLDLEGHLYHGKPNVDMTLREGDTVTVPSKGGVQIGALLSEVLRFGSIITAVTSLVVALN